MKFLIYGANGYTGTLVVEYCSSYQLTPVISGRSKDKISQLAKKHQLQYEIFDLKNHDILVNHLKKFKVVLNCAGPFSQTAKPLIDACLETSTHYLDITGELNVFEWAKSQDAKAIKSNICLIPGVGFDVVPTDCIASCLYQKMKDAKYLTLAFASLGGELSHGTATTLVEALGYPGAIRKNGKIVRVPIGHKGKNTDFGKETVFTMTIPWGDVSTAYTTTGIPNIEVFTRVPQRHFKILKFQVMFNWILRMQGVKRIIQKWIDKNIYGPNKAVRSRTQTYAIGIVKNAKGEELKALLQTTDGYEFTAHAALLATKKVINESYSSGYKTPASIFGFEFVMRIPQTTMEIIE